MENYELKVGVILNISMNIGEFSCVIVLPDQNLSIPLDQNVSILLVNNMYNGNIETFWHRKLCIFLEWFFGPKNTTCMLRFFLINIQAPSQFRLVSFRIEFVEFKAAGLLGFFEFKQFSIP